jgi:hypothetical protein
MSLFHFVTPEFPYLSWGTKLVLGLEYVEIELYMSFKH